MGILNSTVKAVAALCVSGTLFFSCALNNPGEYGTLLVALSGTSGLSASTARAAVSDTYTATLSYRIECSGSGRVSREALPGASVSIPLSAGDWVVTVTVLNIAGENIGSAFAPATIESGKTTLVRIPVSIDTSGNSITRFALTSPVSAQGLIGMGNTITVSVPFGTDTTGMNWTATHTGLSIAPSPGTPLDFGSPQTFTVTAENPATPPKTYTVTVNFEAPPIPGGTAVWPPDTTWQPYGLINLTQPSGTTVQTAAVSSGTLMVFLQNAGTVFGGFINQIETVTGSIGTTSGPVSGYTLYELLYTYGSRSFTLTITHHTSGTLYLMVEPDDPSGFIVWPGNARWADFGLSGLTQPALTTLTDVTETNSPYEMLSVTLSGTITTVYDYLLAQITAKLGNPVDSHTNSDGTRDATFMVPAGAGMLVVALEKDASNNVTVFATKM